jgi:thiamine kinase-like enzyme
MAGEVREEHDARSRLATLPGFSRELAQAAQLTRLVGMNNRVYRVDVDGRSVCLRMPGNGAAAAVDRRLEEVNARAAAEAGVAPEVLYFGEDGLMLTRFIEDAVALRPERILASEGALKRGAQALRRLHESGTAFAGTFEAFGKIEDYVAALRRFRRAPTELEQAAIDAMPKIQMALAVHPSAPKPCHCDPTGRNLLDTGEKVWLVDWEYSGMNDPMWDLAYFSVESLLDEAGDRALLAAYFGRMPDVAEAARMAVWKPVCEVQAALWALIQAAEGNPGGDFTAYAKVTFARAAERMRGDEFRRQLIILTG